MNDIEANVNAYAAVQEVYDGARENASAVMYADITLENKARKFAAAEVHTLENMLSQIRTAEAVGLTEVAEFVERKIRAYVVRKTLGEKTTLQMINREYVDQENELIENS